MKSPLIACAAAVLLAAAPALRAEEARVISSIPVIQQVAVPRQVCTTQQVMVEQPRSGAGAAMGAIAGGALGNQVGHGSGRAVATIAGVIGGAMLGNRIEGGGAVQPQEQVQCSTQTTYESRTVGYNVTYEYAGRQYQVQSPQDPGPVIRVQVTPVLPAPATAIPAMPVQPSQPVRILRGPDGYVAPVAWGAPPPAPAYWDAPGAYRHWR